MPLNRPRTTGATTLPLALAAIATLSLPLIAGLPLQAQAAAAATAHVTQAVKANKAFDVWSDHFAEDWVRQNPQLATSTQYFSGAEQDKLDRQLTPLTTAQRKKMIALAKTGVARLLIKNRKS